MTASSGSIDELLTQFELDDVPNDAKVVLDVWSKRAGADRDEFLGKVTVRLESALRKPELEWQDLVVGRLHFKCSWAQTTPSPKREVLLTMPEPAAPPQLDAPTGVAAAEPAAPSPARAHAAAPPRAVESPKRAPAVKPDARAAPAKPSPKAASPKAVADASAARAKPAAARLELFEYTHKGGSGHGPKENQDTYFVLHFDASDRPVDSDGASVVIGVLDGHGGDHGRIASQAASSAMQRYLRKEFGRMRRDGPGAMEECFKRAHEAIFKACLH